MAKKRKCRLTADELDVHKRAVNLRKMTDEQLVDYVDGKNAPRAKETGHTAHSEDKALKNTHTVEKLIQSLADGLVKGIGKTTVEKIRSYAESEGYLT